MCVCTYSVTHLHLAASAAGLYAYGTPGWPWPVIFERYTLGPYSVGMSERQTLDCGPRGGAGTEVLSALSASKKKSITFFKGDDTRIGEHTVFDFDGEAQSVGMVQTWNQCNELLLTSQDKSHSILLMDTETGATKSELSMRRERKNWKLEVDSITPMQKFEQYKQSQGFQIFGLGDDGKTVFGMSHDTRIGENVEEFVVHADSCRKYKTYTFSCHAQTKVVLIPIFPICHAPFFTYVTGLIF